MIDKWISMSVAQRDSVCERVYRHIKRSGGASATGIMHGCAMLMDHVSGALLEMEQRGAVQRKENSAGVEIWTIVPKHTLTQRRH